MPLTKTTFLAPTLVALLLGAPAHASECADRPRVQVHVEAARPALARRTLDLVTAELTARRGSCEGAAEDREPARIVLRWLDDSHVRIEVELRGVRAERDVNHAEIPTDGVPAALAIATDELLRSLYEEERTTTPPADEPESDASELEAPPSGPPDSSERASHSFGLGLAFEAFPATRSLVGPEARLGIALSPRLALDLHLGLFALVPPFEASARDHHHRLIQLGVHARHEIARPSPSLTLSAIAGADALVLLDASPVVARPALRVGLRASLPAGPRMRLDAGLDAMWLPFAVETSRVNEPVLSGFGLAPSVGWVATF